LNILIDTSEAWRNRTGIGRFSRALLRHLPDAVPPDMRIILSQPDYAARDHARGPRTLPGRLRHFGGHMALTQAHTSLLAARHAPDVVHSLSFFTPLAVRARRVTTFFDLAYLDLPEHTDRFWGAYARAMMPRFARLSDAIITTSQVMRGRIAEAFAVPPERIHVVYGAAEPAFQPLDASVPETASHLDAVRARYALPETFFLYAGAWGRTKDLPTLIRACARLRDGHLVLTGTPHNPAEAEIVALAEKLGARAQFIGHVADGDLPALYNLAHAVVLPSLYEGFGLPALEGMACGRPVVVSDIPVLAEVTGGAALRFPAGDADALFDQLTHLLYDAGAHAAWAGRALAHAQGFTWPTVAHEIVSVWQGLNDD
jgi:glycosyltransferase involved in cell wall biosynthesis